MNKDYAVLVIGGFTEGEFSDSQIKTIFEKLSQYKIHVVVIGFEEQKHKIMTISKKLNHLEHIVNTCGVLQNYELPYIINQSKFVITPNTGTYHMALLLNKKTILIEKKVTNYAAKYDIPLNIYINPKEDLKNLSDISILDIEIAIDSMIKNINKRDVDWQSVI